MRDKVIILSGVSGIGKTTYAKTFESRIVSADNYFMSENGREYTFNATALGFAHANCFRNFLTAMGNNEAPIIVDNTNTTIEEIAPYYLGAKAHGYDVEIVIFKGMPYQNVHGVSEKTVSFQKERLAALTIPKYWECTLTTITRTHP